MTKSKSRKTNFFTAAAISALALLGFPISSLSTQIPDSSASFVDVSDELGIVSKETAQRTQLIDINEDGWLDLVVSGTPFRVLVSHSTPTSSKRSFIDGSAESGLGDRNHSLLLWGDLNTDGHLDVISIVTQTAEQFQKDPQTYAVYLGDGHGHFRRQRHSGLEQKRHTATHGAVLIDLDLDGNLDVAFGNQYDGGWSGRTTDACFSR